MTRHTHTIDFAARHACDLCGDDEAELRLFSFDGWVPDERWCRECFGGPHEESEFTDFPLAQEAKTNA